MKFLSVLNRKCAIALTVFLLYQVGMVQLELNICFAKPAHLDRQIKHVSSYQSMEGARENVNSLKSRGIDAFYEKVMIPGKGFWYRVYAVKNQTLSQSRSTVESKKKSPVKAIQKADTASVKTKKINPSPSKSDRPMDKPQSVKESSNVSQMTLKKTAVPRADEKKLIPSPEPKTIKETEKNISENNINKNTPIKSEYESAKAEFAAGRYDKAAGIFSWLISKKQGDASQYENSMRSLADCYYFLGERGDESYNATAIEAYKNILRYYPDIRSGNDLANFRMATCLERSENYEEAYTAYENVFQKYPVSTCAEDTLYKMGEILYLTKRFAHAAEKLKSYLAKYPNGRHAFKSSFILGYCLRQINQQNEGALWYKNALSKWNELDELPANILCDLGLYLFSQKDYANSVNLFSLYLNLHPEDELKKEALFHLGMSFYHLNQFSPALKVFSLILETYPDTVEANESILFMANIGVIDPKTEFNVCMAGRDYFRNPIETYDWMREKYPGGRLEEWLLYQKGYALLKRGRNRDAFDVYCELLDRFNHGTLHKESEAYLALCARHLIDGSFEKGDYLVVADTYFKVRNKIGLSPERTGMFFKIGDSLWRVGLKSDAIAVLDRLKQVGQNESQQSILDMVMMEMNYSQGEITEEKWNALLKEFAKNNSQMASVAKKNTADYYYKKGQYDKVIPLYEALLKDERNSGIMAIQGNYADALKNKKLCASAINRYVLIINKCRENPQKCDEDFVANAYAGLGDCYFETGDFQRSISMHQYAFPRLKDKDKQMWALFRQGQGFKKINDATMAGKTFSELKEKSGDTFWPKVVDYWVADQTWSGNNLDYIKKN